LGLLSLCVLDLLTWHARAGHYMYYYAIANSCGYSRSSSDSSHGCLCIGYATETAQNEKRTENI
jgi:hypothetical protein